MPKWSPDINHLAYADDTIVFASANEESLILIMNTLSTYEIVSVQKMNKGKIAIFLHHNANQEIEAKVSEITRRD